MPAKTLDISEARRRFNTLDRRLKKARVIRVQRHHRDAFALIDLEYLEALQETLEILSDPEAMQQLKESLEDIRAGRLIDQEQLERELL